MKSKTGCLLRLARAVLISASTAEAANKNPRGKLIYSSKGTSQIAMIHSITTYWGLKLTKYLASMKRTTTTNSLQ
jgi:hypothetical protein